jgi:Protein of unknown function (DUF1071)
MRIVLWHKLRVMIKDFNELRKVDVLPFCKKLDEDKKFNYLPWLACLDILRENGAEVIRYDCSGILYTEVNGGKQVLVRVKVVVDGQRCSITHAVANGEIPITNPNALQIGFAIQRAMVKAVAINFGLGLDLWKDIDNDAAPAPKDSTVALRIPMAFDAKRSELGLASAADLHEKLGTDKKFLDNLISKGSKEDQMAFIEKLGAVAKEELF